MKKIDRITFYLIDKSRVSCLDKEWRETNEAHVITKIVKDSSGVNEEKTFIPKSSVVKIEIQESQAYEE